LESIYQFSEQELLAFALIFVRSVAFIVAMPVIGTNSVTAQVKILLALAMSFVLKPVISTTALSVGLTDSLVPFLAMKEIFIGLCIGFIARLFFMCLAMAGQIISVSLGVSSAQLYNPAFNETSSAFDQFFLILATLFFFAINGHHQFIIGLVQSYKIIPLSLDVLAPIDPKQLSTIGQTATEMAIRFSAPILVTILFTNLAMGIVGRAVPQINILITSLPVNTLVGFFVLFVSLPMVLMTMDDLLGQTLQYVFAVLKAF
jgi:flagellar biosynthesis protein FliR